MSRLTLPPEAVESLKALIESYKRLKADAIAAAAPAPQPTPAQSGATGSPVPVTLSGPASSRPGTDYEVEQLEKRAANPSQVWWTDLIQAEMCLLEVLDEATLRARVSGWRRRMQEILGDARFSQYIAGAPNPSTAALDEVRADLGECIRAVYYFYSAYGVAARSRSDVTQSTFNVALCILALQGLIAIILALHVPWNWWPAIPTNVLPALEYLVATSAAAVLGSVVSVQTRLQDPKVDVDPFYRYVQTHADKLSIAYVSPIFAAIFGLVIFGLMASGLTGGSAFPDIAHIVSSSPSLPDIAKLLIYGFLAGFAERLVPDALTRIAARTLASIAGGDGSQPPTAAASASKLVVLPPSVTLAAASQATFRATFSGSKDDITAVSSDSSIATVDADAKKGPGPVTFSVQALKTGQCTVNVSSGTQTATINVLVT